MLTSAEMDAILLKIENNQIIAKELLRCRQIISLSDR